MCWVFVDGLGSLFGLGYVCMLCTWSVDFYVCCVCYVCSMYRFSKLDVLQLGNHDDNSTHPPHRTSLLPRPVLTLRAPNLALLEQTLPPPLTPRRIHIP